MGRADVASRRSFALVGHAGDGKTSVAEGLLHAAGATKTLGRVDDGSSQLDHWPEEKERRHTLSSHVFGFDHADHVLTLVDTPGDPNFRGEGQICLAAVDGAVLVVSAVDGVKVGTDAMWRAARSHGLPCLAFVNGMDRERADLDAALASLAELEGARPVLVTLPIGAEGRFEGVVDVLRGVALRPGGEGEIPEDLRQAAAAARDHVAEAVAESDDALIEKYLEEGTLSDEEVTRGLLAAVRSGQVLPVLCGAAPAQKGIASLLRAATEWLPSPAERPPRPARAVEGGAELELAADPAAPFTGLVFKTVVDRYAGTLSIFRVFSGTVHPDLGVLNATTGVRERLGKLMRIRGAEHEDVAEAGPGDIVAVAKLKEVRTGHALTAEKKGAHLAEIAIPTGALSYAIRARAKEDEDKVFSSLARLVEEDPTLHLGREATTGEFLLTGVGELHIRIAIGRLKRLYGVEAELRTPKVPYRETVVGRAENVEGKLKKQTGGKGMFGVCYLTVEPRPRGAGLEFSDEIVGGSIPRNLIPAVEKGVLEAAAHGPLGGFPVVDVRVRCTDGKFHPVDSNEMAFKIAGSLGFKAAVEKARPTLLEPIMNAEISVPSESVGDVMGDISGRRGRVQSSEGRGPGQVIKAQVPMAEMLEYASALTSLTGGKGAFHMEFSHYEEVPAHLREKIVAEAQALRAQES
jgi:elongation factor G